MASFLYFDSSWKYKKNKELVSFRFPPVVKLDPQEIILTASLGKTV